MYTEVVVLAHTQRNQIYVDGKYLVHFHALVVREMCHDMQLA
jgi:hypothetical protein